MKSHFSKGNFVSAKTKTDVRKFGDRYRIKEDQIAENRENINKMYRIFF